jgi:hypothetical protein
MSRLPWARFILDFARNDKKANRLGKSAVYKILHSEFLSAHAMDTNKHMLESWRIAMRVQSDSDRHLARKPRVSLELHQREHAAQSLEISRPFATWLGQKSRVRAEINSNPESRQRPMAILQSESQRKRNIETAFCY